ncbi:MAG: hypothetical protein ACREJC_14545, partial [Tepidisphaeraceae bacterium]
GYGAVAAPRGRRHFALTMFLIAIVLALGSHAPLLYDAMFKLVPKYDNFRGTVKFAMFATLFIGLLAALGFDRLLETRRVPRSLIAACTTMVVMLGMMAMVIQVSAPMGASGDWGRFVGWIGQKALEGHELFTTPPQTYSDREFLTRAARHAVSATTLAAGATALATLTLVVAAAWRRAAYALIPLAALELLAVNHASRATTSPDLTLPPGWQTALAKLPSDSRVFVGGIAHANSGMYFGYDNIWGYDPGVLKRYAEMMTASQGFDPATAGQYLMFNRIDPNVFDLIRCRLILPMDPDQLPDERPGLMPTLRLIRNYAVLRDRDSILRTLTDVRFEPRDTVLLESEPDPKPVKGAEIGTAEVVRRGVGTLEIKADVPTPAILLITENYSRDWHARPRETGPQSSYPILSADWALMAIPLAAGQHHLVLAYAPRSFYVGAWISGVALVGMVGWGAWLLAVRRRSNSLTSCG